MRPGMYLQMGVTSLSIHFLSKAVNSVVLPEIFCVIEEKFSFFFFFFFGMDNFTQFDRKEFSLGFNKKILRSQKLFQFMDHCSQFHKKEVSQGF